jgi:chromosome segregation ATPase
MRGVLEAASSRDIKSMRSISMRSIPKSHRSFDLELFLIKKARSRMKKELEVLEKRRNSLIKQLDFADNNIEQIQAEIKEQQKPKKEKKAKPAGEISVTPGYKTVSIQY